MKLPRAFKATLILTLFFIANVQDLILHSKLENMRILQAKKHKKAHHNKTKKVAKKHKKHHAVAKKHHSRRLVGLKKKKLANKTHRKKTAVNKRAVKAAHKKHTRKMSKKHSKSKHHAKKHHKNKGQKRKHRSLRSGSSDIGEFSAFDSFHRKIGPSDSITSLIFIILLILMLGAFFNRKPNRKLDLNDSGASGIGGLNILDLLMGGNDINDILKKEKKKILRFMKENSITFDEKTPYKDVVNLTRTYVQKQYNMDEETFEQFKPLIKKFYKKLIQKKDQNLKDKDTKAESENQNTAPADNKASVEDKRKTRKINAI